MSVASLSRFTVPLPGASSQGMIMPKLKYRFRAFFENFGVSAPRSELSKNVIDITRPVANFDPIELHVYNSKVNLTGKPSWSDVTINLRDDVNGEVSRRVGEQVQKQFDFFEQSSAASGMDYKFTLRYEMLDGGNGAYNPNVLESWEIYGAFILSVDYGNMDYSASEAATIALTIKFDNALQIPLGSGIGANVGRTINTAATA